jgi:predicted DNA-binding protein (MmcQ/YjbR family)
VPPRPLTRLRKLCLALPEAHEVEAWGEPTFRVKNKLFAMHAAANNHHGGGRPAVWLKSTREEQARLLAAFPGRFFSPPYVGKGGWVGIWLDEEPDWDLVADFVREAYLLIAPKKLAARLVPD